MRRTVACLLAAGALTTAIWLAAQSLGRHWFNQILLLPYLVGAAVSGNIHAPNVTVVWLCVFLLLFVSIFGGVKALHVYSQWRKHRARR